MTGELLPSLAYLQAQLQQEIESGKMRISLEPRGLVVSLQQATFFPSGEDTLDPATYFSLEKVAIAMRKLPNPVRLEGHTDAIPDPHRPVPQQLGAFGGARYRGSRSADGPLRNSPRAPCHCRIRGYGAFGGK